MDTISSKPPVVALYLRVSTSQQDFEMQMNDLNKEVEKMGAEVFHTYTDTIGGATQTFQRKYAEDVIRDAGDSKFQILLVWRIDRIARDEEYGLTYLRRIEEKGCRVNFVTQPSINSPEHFTTEGASMIKTMRNMLLMGARMEHENIKARTRAAKMRLIKSNKWPATGHVPDGYILDRTTGGLLVNPARAPMIKRLFSLYVDSGLSTRQICKTLNEEGVPAATAKSGKWVKDSVQDKLSNSVYTGKLPIQGKKLGFIHTFTCEPIISDERFAEAQKVKIDRTARSTRNLRYDYPFRPFLTCAKCGYDLHAMHSLRTETDNGFTIHYGYRKPNGEVKFKRRCLDGCGRISEIKLVNSLYEHIYKFVEHATDDEITNWLDDNQRYLPNDEEELVRLKAELEELHNQAEKVIDLYPHLITTKEKLQLRLKKINSQIKPTEEKIRILEQKRVSQKEHMERGESLAMLTERIKYLILRTTPSRRLKEDGTFEYFDIEPDYNGKRKTAIEILQFVKNIRVDFQKKLLYVYTRTPKYLDGVLSFEPEPKVKRGRPPGSGSNQNGSNNNEINSPIVGVRENSNNQKPGNTRFLII